MILAALLVMQAPETVLALSATWNGAADALWATAGNWSTSPVPGVNDTATFNNGGGAVDVVNLAGVMIHAILFDTNAAAYTLGAGALNSQTLTLTNGGAITLNPATANNQLCNAAVVLGTDGSAQVFAVSNNTAAMTLTLAGSVTGSSGAGIKTLAVAGSGPVTCSGALANGSTGTLTLTKSGAGTLTLASTANTYSGGTGISANGGSVIATTTNGTNLTGLGPGAVAIGSGSTLQLLSANTAAAATTVNNPITGTGTLMLTFTETANATYTVLGGVSGFTGTIRLSNNNAANKDKWYANNLGALNAALVIDSASQIFVSGGPAAFTRIAVSGTGNAEGYGAIRLGNTLGGNLTLADHTTIGLGGGTLTGNISSGAAGTQTLTLGTSNARTSATLSGIIGGGTGTLAVISAAGTSTLSGANTYTGNTFLNGGTLILGHNLALQNSVLDTSGAGLLAVATGITTPTLGGLAGSSNLTVSAGVTALTLNTRAGITTTYSGVLGSATAGMSLTKTGEGTQVLSGANAFTGPTRVSQGLLRMDVNRSVALPAGMKIMPLGDSITHGSSVAGGYRYFLHGLLNPVAPGYQMVGESTENPGSLPTTPLDQLHHCGHSSYSCNDINHNLDGLDTATFVQYGGVSRDPHGGYWLTGGNGTGREPIYPDAVLLLAAANDISRVGMTGVQGRIEDLLTKLNTLRPNARVFLAKASPYAGFDTSVAAFNHIIDTVAANYQAAGKPITVVDLNAGFPAGQFVDAVHPNATGYSWMANRWFDALVSVYGSYGAGPISTALATTSAVTVDAGARLEGSGPLGGPLTVAGTVAPGVGIGSLSAGATAITGSYACDLDATTCDQLVVAGDLTLTNATLAITPLAAPAAASYIIASYTGILHGAFTQVTGLPAGYIVAYDPAAKMILLATPYDAWRRTNGLAESSNSMTLDPDGDGATNLLEFALGGNPRDAAAAGYSCGKIQALASDPVFTLTIAARAGASFVASGNQAMTATRDGIIYQVEASRELATWTGEVIEVTPPWTTGLPAAPAGYEYHTFKPATPVAGNPQDFLRLKVSSSP